MSGTPRNSSEADSSFSEEECQQNSKVGEGEPSSSVGLRKQDPSSCVGLKGRGTSPTGAPSGPSPAGPPSSSTGASTSPTGALSFGQVQQPGGRSFGNPPPGFPPGMSQPAWPFWPFWPNQQQPWPQPTMPWPMYHNVPGYQVPPSPGAPNSPPSGGEVRPNPELSSVASASVAPHSDQESLSDGELSSSSTEDTMLGAFQVKKAGPPIPDSLASLTAKALSSPADTQVIKDLKEKYLPPDNVPLLCVPSVNKSIWTQAAAYRKDNDHSLQRVQGALVSSISATTYLATELRNLRKLYPKEARFHDLDKMGREATLLASHASYMLSCHRREQLKPIFKQEYRDLCAKTQPISDQLFGPDLTKDCRDLAEQARATGSIFHTQHKNQPFRQSGRQEHSGDQRGKYKGGRPFKPRFNSNKPYQRKQYQSNKNYHQNKKQSKN